ncbi:Nuclear Glucose-responsive WD40 protein1, GLUCOSE HYPERSENSITIVE 40 [Hibiscus trionum]|uniref:Nuclear Glucose-responsive WD40 protein1, GLUCOSE HYPERSENSITIVE 40 n=1 Tax=Hibiscus trionum TaxID=183268 RepID=A0A9W7IEZ4_HIBTR|nr:Nuclear Glucose-responsive WD40 protein1, GLUCOSE HYPERSENSITIVE 40 [Hibiscus trionum]
MGWSNMRDILTAFSPSLDYFAISSGDGRIKIWDTLKGQIQTEFVDIISSEATNLYAKAERGHLSIDYKCMKWLSFEKKKKRKLGSSLLVLGTGSGDVLALDVSAGQLKWKVSDCHPGGVSAIAFATNGSCIYSAGADGMVCEIDSLTGNLLGKFRASVKSISCMTVSSDGKTLVTAAAQLKTFDCSNHKKIQKFTGHPGSVRCMIFTENGKFILSSAVAERYIAVWKAEGGKKQSASCVLAMEHAAVFIDSKCVNEDIYVFAISETGVCYFWYGQDVETLRNAKPTKLSISLEDGLSKPHKGALPTIFAAKLQGVPKPESVHAFLAHGLLVKPLFQKIVVQYGSDILLSSSQDGVLLPRSQFLNKSKKGLDAQNRVIALDRANAEDATLPIPKIFYPHEEKEDRHRSLRVDANNVMTDSVDPGSQPEFMDGKDDSMKLEAGSKALCMEDQLRSLGILDTCNAQLDSIPFNGINLEANLPPKKMRAAIFSMEPGDAHKLLENLVKLWQSRSYSGKYVLPWIYSLLLTHGHLIMSRESVTQMLNSLSKNTKSRGSALQSLLQLSGRLQLIATQIGKAAQGKSQHSMSDHPMDESEDEDGGDDDDVDDVLYGEEDESQISSDDDN